MVAVKPLSEELNDILIDNLGPKITGAEAEEIVDIILARLLVWFEVMLYE